MAWIVVKERRAGQMKLVKHFMDRLRNKQRNSHGRSISRINTANTKLILTQDLRNNSTWEVSPGAPSLWSLSLQWWKPPKRRINNRLSSIFQKTDFVPVELLYGTATPHPGRELKKSPQGFWRSWATSRDGQFCYVASWPVRSQLSEDQGCGIPSWYSWYPPALLYSLAGSQLYARYMRAPQKVMTGLSTRWQRVHCTHSKPTAHSLKTKTGLGTSSTYWPVSVEPL